MATSTEFSYFDQFHDVQIDLTPYFDAINSNSSFKYSFTNIQPIKTTLKNIFEQVDLVNNIKSTADYFTSYKIGELESPEKVSHDFYGTQNNWWILALFNDMKNLINDWPMSEAQLQYLADQFYQKEGKYTRETYYNLLSQRNDKRRNIIVLKEAYINDVITAFRKEIEMVNN